MADEEIKVKFTGDAGQLAKTTKDLTDQLKRFEDELKKLPAGSDSFNRINRAIEATKSRIELLNKVNAFQNVKKGSDQATQSLINLSRVAQDAPYGFIGIANNLNPLLESFQRLKTETGGSKAALTALVSGLTGPAGIGLALGVVSSLLVTFGDKLFSSKSGIDANAIALERFKVAAEEAATRVDKLKDAFDNMNRVAKLRLELNVGKGGQADLMDLQALSVQQRAIVKASSQAYIDLTNGLSNAEAKLRANLSPAGNELMDQGLLGGYVGQMEEDTKKAYDLYKDIQKKTEEAGKKLSEESARQNELYAQQKLKRVDIEEETQKKVEEAQKKAEAAQKKHDDEMEKLRQRELEMLIRHQNLRVNLENQEGPLEDRKAGSFDKLPSKTMTDAVEIRVPVIVVPEGVEVDIDKVNDAIDRMLAQQKFEKKLEQMQGQIKSFAEYMGDTMGKAVEGVFDAIVDGEDPLKAFLNSLKQAVKQVAGELIATYIRVAIFKALASPATGGGSAASGAQGLLKILGFSKGGFVPGGGSGDSVPAMLTPGELVVPKSFAASVGAMLGYTSSTLNRAQASKSNTSKYMGDGSMAIHVTGEFVNRGDDMVATISKVIKAQRRSFGN